MVLLLLGLPVRGVRAAGFCHEASGYVHDTYSRPISGASVRVGGACGDIVFTDTSGHYTNYVEGGPLGGSESAYVTKTGFVSEIGYISGGVLGGEGNNFTLRFDLSASLSPTALRPGNPLTIQASSTAPPPGDPLQAGSRMIAQPPSGLRLDLTQGVTDAAGWTAWSGSFTPPVGTADGSYVMKVCAVEKTFAGNCDQAAALGPPSIATQVRSLPYQVDDTPPSVASSSPARFGDALRLSTVSVTWQDLTSGIDPSSMLMWIDGVPAAVSVSGSTVSASAAGIAPGIHVVKVEARDRAGNTATDSFLFTLVSISGSAGTASLVEQTVPVNPGGTIPPPSTVSFPAPQVDVSQTTETIGASTRVGTGVASRAFSLGTADIVFRNGALTSTVTVSVPTSTESHPVATLAPSGAPLRAVVPARRVSIPAIMVNVPAGFNTPGSTATLVAKTVPLGSHVLPAGSFLQNLPVKAPVLGTIGVCLTGDGGGTYGSCEVDPQGGVTIGTDATGDVRYAYVPTDQVEDSSGNATTVQTCSGCDPGGPFRPKSYASLALQCPTVTLPTGTYNLCTGVPGGLAAPGPWAAYLNAWLYREADHSRFPLWQQNHAEAGMSACPNGLSGQAKAQTYRLVANTTANDGSAGAIIGGTWDDPNNRRGEDEVVYLGRLTGNNRQQVEDPAITYQLSNANGPQLKVLQQGSYLPVRVGVSVTPTGAEVPQAAATSTGWQLATAATSPGSGIDGSLQLFTGTEYRSPTVPGSYNLSATLAFQFVLDLGGCG